MTMSKTNKKEDELYKDVEIDGTVDERPVKPTIKTEVAEVLKDNDREILIGKDIEEIEDIEEDFSSKKRKLINKLMR